MFKLAMQICQAFWRHESQKTSISLGHWALKANSRYVHAWLTLHIFKRHVSPVNSAESGWYRQAGSLILHTFGKLTLEACNLIG